MEPKFFEAIIAPGFLIMGLSHLVQPQLWDWPLVLTIAGWGMTIKSAAYLLVPGLASRALSKKMATTPRSFQIVGAPMAVIGAILTWQAWMR